MGHLIEQGGLFLRDMAVTFGDTSLALRNTQLDWEEPSPNITMIAYGVTIEVEHCDQKETILLRKSDHYGNLRDFLDKRVEFHHDAVHEQLLAWAEAYAEHFSTQSANPISWVLNEHNELPKLFVCLLMAPRPGSLVSWAQTALNESSFAPLEATHKGHSITLTVKEYAPPRESLSRMECTIGFSVEVSPPRELDLSWGEPWMSLGCVEDEWLERSGPTTPEQRAYVDMLLAKWRDDTVHFLKYFLKKDGFGSLSGIHWQFNMPTFWFFDLLTYYLAHGAPPAPPVPAFTPKDIARAATIVQRASDEVKQEVSSVLGRDTSRPFAVYDLKGYTLVFADALDRHIPFYAFSMLLRPPGSEHFITILMNDVWNPQAARVIDGDVFALRRLVEWLRGAIKKNKLNERITFEGEDDETEEMSKTSIWVTDWLLFHQPEPKDELLADWRCQHYVASAGPECGIAGFAGIYGFTTDYQQRLVEEDIPAWRRFLREVVDERFDYAWGEQSEGRPLSQ